jgi:hypothetical protein
MGVAPAGHAAGPFAVENAAERNALRRPLHEAVRRHVRPGPAV